MASPAKSIPAGIRLSVRLQPRASRNEVCGLFGEGAEVRLKLRLTAPPVDNAANGACQAFLAELFGVAKGAVRLVSGDKSRDKHFEIAGDSQRLLARAEELAR